MGTLLYTQKIFPLSIVGGHNIFQYLKENSGLEFPKGPFQTEALRYRLSLQCHNAPDLPAGVQQALTPVDGGK